MFILGLVLALAGIAGAAWWWAMGPILWAPFALLMFCFGCLICGLASVRQAIEKSTERIVDAIKHKPSAPLPVDTFAAGPGRAAERDMPSEVAATPHPSKRCPTFEELTGKSGS